MDKLTAFFKLIRFKNILIIALTQYLIRYALIIPMTQSFSLSDMEFALLVLSTLFIAAGGYIINDYFDTKVDRLNQKTLIIDHTIKRREAILMHIVLSTLGVFIGFYLGWKVGLLNLGLINLFSVTALWFYSTHLKKENLSGNLLISLLAALVLLVVPLYDIIPNPNANGELAFYAICNYAIFAFLTTFIREVVKDFEDASGDHKMGFKTFAIKHPKSAIRSIQFLSLILIVIIGFVAVVQINYEAYYAALYVIIAVILPFIYFFAKLLTATEKVHFYHLSQVIKWIMVTGTLSILVFTLLF